MSENPYFKNYKPETVSDHKYRIQDSFWYKLRRMVRREIMPLMNENGSPGSGYYLSREIYHLIKKDK